MISYFYHHNIDHVDLIHKIHCLYMYVVIDDNTCLLRRKVKTSLKVYVLLNAHPW